VEPKQPESTCWTEVRGAAAGDAGEREAFARRYSPVVRAGSPTPRDWCQHSAPGAPGRAARNKLLASASRAGERIRARVIDPLSIAAKLETEEKS